MSQTRSKEKRRKAYHQGHRGETIAIWFLRAKGYQILERRYRTKTGEIDLIARRGKWLVFVEVKYRHNGATAQDVPPFQADRMVRTASLYLARYPQSLKMETRFDLVLLGNWRWPRHIKGAFGDDSWGGYSIT